LPVVVVDVVDVIVVVLYTVPVAVVVDVIVVVLYTVPVVVVDFIVLLCLTIALLYLLPPMDRVLLLLLPSTSIPPLPLFELFLCSSLVAAVANNDDDDDVEYNLSSTAHSLLHSEINSCRIN